MANTLAIRTMVVTMVVGVGLALAGCGTPSAAPGPAPAPHQAPVDRSFAHDYAGRPADRITEDVQRRRDAGQLPSPDCRRHVVVEHPDGGYHLACIAPAPEG